MKILESILRLIIGGFLAFLVGFFLILLFIFELMGDVLVGAKNRLKDLP